MKSYNSYYTKIDNQWVHRTPLKCIVNPILRKLQWFTDKPYVIASVTEFRLDVPKFEKYVIQRIKMNSK